MSNAFVVLLGISTVFIGLVIIIALCKLMSVFVRITEKVPVQATVSASPVAHPATIPDKQPLLAAISGTDISNIRIHSIKRV